MNFTRRIADFFKQFTPPRPQVKPKVNKIVAPESLKNGRASYRRRGVSAGGAHGRRIFRINPRPAINAARGPRWNTWWKKQSLDAWNRGIPLVRPPQGLHAV